MDEKWKNITGDLPIERHNKNYMNADWIMKNVKDNQPLLDEVFNWYRDDYIKAEPKFYEEKSIGRRRGSAKPDSQGGNDNYRPGWWSKKPDTTAFGHLVYKLTNQDVLEMSSLIDKNNHSIDSIRYGLELLDRPKVFIC